MKMKIIIFIGRILMGIGLINQVARMWQIKMRMDDLFMILNWHRENMINHHWIIEISAAIFVFPPKKSSRYNVQDEERKNFGKKGHDDKIIP